MPEDRGGRRPADTWEDLVRDKLRSALTSTDQWKDLVSQTHAAQVVADQHEGRYLVELLQNVRDARCAARGLAAGLVTADRTARAAIVVTDRGLLVADQGGGFDLEDGQVFDAVRYLKRSSKVDEQGRAKGFAGHKGIGLKAVLRRCQAFQVWSQLPSGRLIEADLRRSRTMDLLNQLIETDERLDDGAVQQARSEDHLLPLFRFPHRADSSVEDADLARSLLGRGGPGPLDGVLAADVTVFQTVVRLDFDDEAWGEEYGRLSAADVWNEVRGLDPRTVLLLGTLGCIDLIRLEGNQGAERVTAHRSVSVQPTSEPLPVPGGGVAVLHRRFEVSAGDEPPQTWHLLAAPATSIDGYDPGDEGDAEVCVGLPDVAPAEAAIDLPLFMYYPIQAPEDERGGGLPFLVHGPFRVKPDRTGLDPSQRIHNGAVLDAAVAVLARSVAWLAEQAGAPAGLPWSLLPRPGDGDGLVSRFRDAVVATVGASACVGTSVGRVPPAVPELFVPSVDLSSVKAGAVAAGFLPHSLIPHAAVLDDLLRWAEDAWGGGLDRLAALRSTPSGWANTLLEALEAWAQDGRELAAVDVSAEQAAAIALLVREAVTLQDGSVDVSPLADRALPVLPCEGDQGGSRLVRAAPPREMSGGRFVARTRVVIFQRAGIGDHLGHQDQRRVG